MSAVLPPMNASVAFACVILLMFAGSAAVEFSGLVNHKERPAVAKQGAGELDLDPSQVRNLVTSAFVGTAVLMFYRFMRPY